MDPVSLGVIAAGSIAASAAGAGVSAMGAAFAGQAQQKMYNYQSAVASMNQAVAKQNADYEVALGEQRAQKVALAGEARTATLIAGAGASGLEIGSGSKADVINSSEKIAQYDQAVTRSDAARKAYGYEVQGADFQAQGTLDTSAGSASRTASDFQVASSIIGGAGSVSSKWVTGNQSGVFNALS